MRHIVNIHIVGVLWSCSNQHISAVEFSQEQSNEKIVTIRNYLAYWKEILDISFNNNLDKYGFYLEDRKYTVERLTNELLKTLKILINKLNISVKPKEEDMAVTDFAQAFKVEKNSDYIIFLNVVDFYIEIFEYLDPKYYKKWISTIIDEMITKCLENQLVSGFYKLLSLGLRMARKLVWFDKLNEGNADVSNCYENLRTFLPLLLNTMMEFKDELLIACLQVLLEAPIELIKEFLPACEASFINIFTIGKTYLPLTHMGIETLERWQEMFEPEVINPMLVKVLPYLDSFLRSKSLGTHGTMPLEKRRKTVQALKKRKVFVELEPELVKVQRKILNFIGKQSLKNCHAYIFSEDITISDTMLGQYQHLKIPLPYEDLHFNINLDIFLTRIIDLALHSSDRKTRTNACELLQACVIVFLGRGE